MITQKTKTQTQTRQMIVETAIAATALTAQITLAAKTALLKMQRMKIKHQTKVQKTIINPFALLLGKA